MFGETLLDCATFENRISLITQEVAVQTPVSPKKRARHSTLQQIAKSFRPGSVDDSLDQFISKANESVVSLDGWGISDAPAQGSDNGELQSELAAQKSQNESLRLQLETITTRLQAAEAAVLKSASESSINPQQEAQLIQLKKERDHFQSKLNERQQLDGMSQKRISDLEKNLTEMNQQLTAAQSVKPEVIIKSRNPWPLILAGLVGGLILGVAFMAVAKSVFGTAAQPAVVPQEQVAPALTTPPASAPATKAVPTPKSTPIVVPTAEDEGELVLEDEEPTPTKAAETAVPKVTKKKPVTTKKSVKKTSSKKSTTSKKASSIVDPFAKKAAKPKSGTLANPF